MDDDDDDYKDELSHEDYLKKFGGIVENADDDDSSDEDIDSISLILYNLYIGDIFAANDEECMEKYKIKVMVNFAKEVESSIKDKFEYVHFSCRDDDTQSIIEYFPKFYDIVEESLSKNKALFVHCAAGVSRSGAAVISYIMKKSNMTYDQAFTFVRKRRCHICPNYNFQKQLENYEVILRKEREKNKK